jgi:hypothetical protein
MQIFTIAPPQRTKTASLFTVCSYYAQVLLTRDGHQVLYNETSRFISSRLSALLGTLARNFVSPPPSDRGFVMRQDHRPRTLNPFGFGPFIA